MKQELIRRCDTRTWRDVSSYMITYLPLNYYIPVKHLLYFRNGRTFTKGTLRILLLSTFRVSSIDYYIVCSLIIHKICALRGILSAISVLLTTEKLRWPWNPGSGWVTVIESDTNEFLVCHFLLLISCIYPRPYIVSFMRYSLQQFVPKSLYFATPHAFNAPDWGVPLALGRSP